MSVTIAVVIPTRNRADIAIRAVRSLLDQDCPIEIFLSDNSASPDALSAFARDEPRVHYLRPERELPMAEHWDWALRRAMAESEASHFTVHYDRKYSKPGHWNAAAAIAEQWPDRLITYPIDMIVDEPPPLRLWQTGWTGKSYLIRTARVAELASVGRVQDSGHALPILSNCLVPRHVLDSIVGRFGNICNSIGPDASFSIRFLALEDDYLHFDRVLAVTFAPHRSSGLGYLSGGGRDFTDFRTMYGERQWLDASPVPGINLGQNIYYHEYELTRRVVGDRLPPLEREGCLEQLGEAMIWVRDPMRRAELSAELRGHGWTGEPPPVPRHRLREMLRHRMTAFLIGRFGFVPKDLYGCAFPDDDLALAYALNHPRPPDANNPHLALLDPVEVGPS